MESTRASIISFLKSTDGVSSREMFEGIDLSVSYAGLKRRLMALRDEGVLVTSGSRRSTKYHLAPTFELQQSVDVEAYFEKEVDERSIREHFNFDLLQKVLPEAPVFVPKEYAVLLDLQAQFAENAAQLSEVEYLKEMERFAIDLSWKSSQIEGNTYSLLETELLLKEKVTASGKTREEATMLLNHKDAVDFILAEPDYLDPLSVARIEDLHSILIKDLGVRRNLRKRRVGISGTNYSPLDNEYQIEEALTAMCELINARESAFDKALLALLLISYIQPFADGNKRTARMVCNAVLLRSGHCPLSFRTVDPIVYKKAMLIFYEQNNLSAFRNIFIEQYEFAVKTYF